MKQLKAITGDLLMNIANDTELENKQRDSGNTFVSEAEKLSSTMPKELKLMFNGYIEQLFALKPTIKRQLSSDSETRAYKQQFVLALHEANINTPEKLEHGLKFARLDSKHPFVDIGLFVSWCKEGYSQHLHEQELLENTKRIMDEKRLISAKPWEERKAEAEEHLGALKAILNNKTV